MSEDLIRRSDAIGACAYETIECYEARKAIRALPSADRPQGEWRKHDDERDYCSRCKHIFKTRTITQQDKWTLYIDDLGYNYCPNCGCDMRGGSANER